MRTTGYAGAQICGLPGAKRAVIRLHCATSKSLWNMEYVARGGTFERPRQICMYNVMSLGERERAHLVLQLGRAACLYNWASWSEPTTRTTGH